MTLVISESMNVALLLSSLANLLGYEPLLSSANTLQKETATCNYVSMLFIKESKRLSVNIKRELTATPTVTRTLAASGSKNISQGSGRKKSNRSLIRFSSCGKIGHILREYRTSKETITIEVHLAKTKRSKETRN